MSVKQIVEQFRAVEPRSVGGAVVQLTKAVLGDTSISSNARSQRTKYDVNKTIVHIPLSSAARVSKNNLIAVKQALAEIYDASIWVTTTERSGQRSLQATFKTTPDLVISAE